MAFEFKRLSDVEVVAEPTESANVLIEEDGVIKKAPKTAVGGAGGSEWDAVIEISSDITSMSNLAPEYLTLISGDYTTLYSKLVAGEHPFVSFKWAWEYGTMYYETWTVSHFTLYEDEGYIRMSGWWNNKGICGTYYVDLNSDNTFATASYSGW